MKATECFNRLGVIGHSNNEGIVLQAYRQFNGRIRVRGPGWDDFADAIEGDDWTRLVADDPVPKSPDPVPQNPVGDLITELPDPGTPVFAVDSQNPDEPVILVWKLNHVRNPQWTYYQWLGPIPEYPRPAREVTIKRTYTLHQSRWYVSRNRTTDEWRVLHPEPYSMPPDPDCDYYEIGGEGEGVIQLPQIDEPDLDGVRLGNGRWYLLRHKERVHWTTERAIGHGIHVEFEYFALPLPGELPAIDPPESLGEKIVERLEDHIASQREMTAEEREAQRKSFAYGNCAIDNPAVTREMINRAARPANPTGIVVNGAGEIAWVARIEPAPAGEVHFMFDNGATSRLGREEFVQQFRLDWTNSPELQELFDSAAPPPGPQPPRWLRPEACRGSLLYKPSGERMWVLEVGSQYVVCCRDIDQPNTSQLDKADFEVDPDNPSPELESQFPRQKTHPRPTGLDADWLTHDNVRGFVFWKGRPIKLANRQGWEPTGTARSMSIDPRFLSAHPPYCEGLAIADRIWALTTAGAK